MAPPLPEIAPLLSPSENNGVGRMRCLNTSQVNAALLTGHPPPLSHLDIYVPDAALVGVEVDDLGAEARLHLGIHLVAGLHQPPGQLQVVFWETVVGPQSQGTGQETHQVVLEGEVIIQDCH